MSPRRNRVDPWGDLHAVGARGMFTGNRGCLVDDDGSPVRHHRGNLWIVCSIAFRDQAQPLAKPGTWTPLFFLDDAVALAAGHRPCGFCRRDSYEAYRRGVESAAADEIRIRAADLNSMLAAERLQRGRGLARAADRRTWIANIADLPSGAVVTDGEQARLLTVDAVQTFTFNGWSDPMDRPATGKVTVLTPRTSVAALLHGYEPALHPSAARG